MSIRFHASRLFYAPAVPGLAILMAAYGCSAESKGTEAPVPVEPAGSTGTPGGTGTATDTGVGAGATSTTIGANPSTGGTSTASTATDGTSTAATSTAGSSTTEPSTAGTSTAATSTAESSTTEPATVGTSTAEASTTAGGIGGTSTAETSTAETSTGGALTGTSTETSTTGTQSTDSSPPNEGAVGIDGYNPDFREFVGEGCDLPEPALLSPASHMLPDPFLMADGSRMSSLSQWACQRAWLKKNVEAFVHGAKPGTPDVVTGTVSSSGVDIHVEHNGKSTDFNIPIALPAGANGPVPAMFQADGSGVPANFLRGEGVAAMSYSHSKAESAFNAIYGNGGPSDQIKWAWAVSRAIDVMVTQRDAGKNDIIDPTALGTTGCSYAGKSAFTVGAFDERIALGLPMESGTGGLGSYRVVGDRDLGPNGGEDPEQLGDACGFDSGWFLPQFCSSYRNNVDALPVDSHFMLAMYAPRGFLNLDNNRIGHLGPVATYAAAAAGAEVFKALGVESHMGYHGGNDTDPHNHCTFYASQEEPARRAIQAFLTRTAEPANRMEPKLKDRNDNPVAFDLANYINWQAPSLN